MWGKRKMRFFGGPELGSADDGFTGRKPAGMGEAVAVEAFVSCVEGCITRHPPFVKKRTSSFSQITFPTLHRYKKMSC